VADRDKAHRASKAVLRQRLPSNPRAQPHRDHRERDRRADAPKDARHDRSQPKAVSRPSRGAAASAAEVSRRTCGLLEAADEAVGRRPAAALVEGRLFNIDPSHRPSRCRRSPRK
jgi:hypothetical protein